MCLVVQYRTCVLRISCFVRDISPVSSLTDIPRGSNLLPKFLTISAARAFIGATYTICRIYEHRSVSTSTSNQLTLNIQLHGESYAHIAYTCLSLFICYCYVTFLEHNCNSSKGIDQSQGFKHSQATTMLPFIATVGGDFPLRWAFLAPAIWQIYQSICIHTNYKSWDLNIHLQHSQSCIHKQNLHVYLTQLS